MGYRLSRKAEQDIGAIFQTGFVQFGLAQADAYHEGLEKTFAFLAHYPRAARERLEIDPPVRIHPYKSHLVVYELDGRDIVILRVRHGREDWMGES